ncbi:MAG TPA: hypothetical protein VFZ53_11290 [Polyangiaceae bacterium]
MKLVKSYLAYARRAIMARKRAAFGTFAAVLALVSLALVIWPRTYESEIRLLVQRSPVLDEDDKLNPLESASDVITRHEKLEALVQELELVKTWSVSRPAALRAKDIVLEKLRGKPSDADVRDALVSMLEGRLVVNVDRNILTITAYWPDAKTAKRIVDAAKESFLQSRHDAEISVIEEKMSILEGHATRLRAEIESIARELGRAKEEKRAAAEKAAREVTQAVASQPAPVRTARRPSPAPSASAKPALSDEDLATLKEELATKKQKLSELQTRRSQQVLETKGRLVDLKLRFTDDHPEVRSAEQRVATLSKVGQEEVTMSEEIKALEKRVRESNLLTKSDTATTPRSGTSGSGTATAPAADALPSEILRLLDQSGDMDPAVGAQLSTALSKYSELRGDIRGARIGLDTAQAAFNHRYKVVMPPVVPLKPSKPKVSLLLAAGFAVALLLGLLVPVALELKTGVIVEDWQVHQLGLPMLGTLKLPPREE